jgi:small subunit ribosomal protein S19e
MPTAREVSAGKLIPAVAAELKKVETIKPHALAGLVKGGVSNERPPDQQDFWYIRSAAVLRKIYLDGPVGTQRLRTAFGGKRRRGHKPAHHRKAGGKFIRLMLQQLEKSGFIAKVEKPYKGRAITAKGQRLLDRAAARVVKMTVGASQ